MHQPYLEPYQTRIREPNMFEDLLGDSLERAFAKGIHDLPGVVAHLNLAGPPCPDSDGIWNENSFVQLMQKLGQ